MKKLILVIFTFLCFSIKADATVLWHNNFDDDTTGTYQESDYDASFDSGFLSDRWHDATADNCVIVDDGTAYSGKSIRIFIEDGVSNTGFSSRNDFTQGYDEIY